MAGASWSDCCPDAGHGTASRTDRETARASRAARKREGRRPELPEARIGGHDRTAKLRVKDTLLAMDAR